MEGTRGPNRSPAGPTATCPVVLANRGLDGVTVGRLGGALTLTRDERVA